MKLLLTKIIFIIAATYNLVVAFCVSIFAVLYCVILYFEYNDGIKEWCGEVGDIFVSIYKDTWREICNKWSEIA